MIYYYVSRRKGHNATEIGLIRDWGWSGDPNSVNQQISFISVSCLAAYTSMLLTAFGSLINLCYRKRAVKQQWFLYNPGWQPLCIELLLTPYFRFHVPNYTSSHPHPSTMFTWALQGLSFSLGWCTWDPSTSWVQSGFLRPWKGIRVCEYDKAFVKFQIHGLCSIIYVAY